MVDAFLECGVASSMNAEYFRGYEKGFEACLQIFVGVMKASLEHGELASDEHFARASQLEMPEASKALAMAIHIASDKAVYERVLKEKADPMNESTVKLLLHELAETDDLPTPLAALGGTRNRTPKWH